MSGDLPEKFTSDPAISALLGALTAEPASGELAGEQAALSMFRGNYNTAPLPAAPPVATAQGGPQDARQAANGQPTSRLPRRSRGGSIWSPARRLRLGLAAAAAAAVIGSVSAAYAAALPPPVQHFAHEILGFAGVPDSRQSSQSATVPGGSSSHGASRHPRATGTGHPSSSPATPRPSSGSQSAPAKRSASASPSPSPSATSSGAPGTEQLAISAASTQIAAGATAVLTGQATQGGKPVANATLTLLERTVARPRWRPVGSAVTSAAGDAVVDVSDLATNAVFRFTDAKGGISGRVIVTVVPAVTLQLTTGPHGRVDALVVSSPYAQPRNFVLLQVQAGSGWVTIRERRIGVGLSRTFLVRARRLEGRTVRAVLPATLRHAAGLSNLVTAPD